MMNRSRMLLCVAALMVFSAAAMAQISEGGTPLSFQLPTTTAVPTVTTEQVDHEFYLAEDAKAGKDTPYRIAAELDVSLNLKNSGVWETVPGGRLWRIRIESPKAYSIALLYDRWWIPAGGKLFIYNDDRSHIIGAFTSFNNWKEGTNITGHVAGDAITVEYFEPDAANGQSDLSIFRIVHAYRNVFGRGGSLDDFGGSGSCNVNIICPAAADWQDEKRGVGLIIEDGSRICTGSLINNTAQDQTPYFLTANHCYSTGATGWVFVFNYESSQCSPSLDGPTTQTVANATLRARWSTSDFCLMELSTDVPLSYNPYFNGWNRVDAAWTSSVCIHHPDCDVKKWSQDTEAPVSDRYLGSGSYTANAHWKIVDWNTGTTEPGSSGSPLFDQNQRITGQLHGGYAACGNDDSDWYGKLSLSWTGNGTNSTRLSNWLDPGSTGATTLDGYNPAGGTITVTSPNGGETWIVGEAYNITWTSSGLSENVKIELNRSYSGGAWETLFASTSNDGSESWTVSGTTTSAARIRISGAVTTTVTDVSNANFTIGVRTITLTAPNGGQTWLLGDANSITWTSANLTGNVKIELNRTYPSASWETLFASTSNDGSESWTVSGTLSTTARIRVSSVSYPTVMDTSNANFTLAARTISLTVPNGGETWLVGDANSITWTSSNLSENVKIELNRSYPGASWETLFASTANDGSESWTVSGAVSSTARIRVSGVTHTTVMDSSNANFTISPRTVTVSAPDGGETWYVGEANAITWTSLNLSENVKIELNRAFPGTTWETLFASTSNDGSESWTVTGPLSTQARIRVSGVTHTTIMDTSNANFTISGGTIAVSSPNGGESWQAGTIHNVTWTTAHVGGNVTIELDRSYPSNWETIAANIGNSGTYAWLVTEPVSGAARIRVSSVNFSTVYDISDANFTIIAANGPAAIQHDPLHDQEPAPFVVTAIITDDVGGFIPKFHYRAFGAGSFDSLTMTATANPDEYAVSVSPLANGHYEYHLRCVDAGGLVSVTDTFAFWVGEACSPDQIYDDGGAEASHWSDQEPYLWAVKFEATGVPFMLCDARIGISAEHPDGLHSPIEVQVLDDDGVGGLPGTVLLSRTAGSIGNVIGGVPTTQDNFALVLFRDGSGNPLEVSGSFYIAVRNPVDGLHEAFLHDTNSVRQGRSFVYDPCDSTWYDELSVSESARPGNRMIRIGGFSPLPPTVVVNLQGADMRLDWNDTGAPYYRIYSSTTVNGAFTTLEGSSSTNSFVDVGAASEAIKFYVVTASTTP